LVISQYLIDDQRILLLNGNVIDLHGTAIISWRPVLVSDVKGVPIEGVQVVSTRKNLIVPGLRKLEFASDISPVEFTVSRVRGAIVICGDLDLEGVPAKVVGAGKAKEVVFSNVA